MQFKEGLDWEAHQAAEAAAAAAEATAQGNSCMDQEREMLLLRLWAALMAITHRLFGVQFGGDVARLVAQWQASLDHGVPLSFLGDDHCRERSLSWRRLTAGPFCLL